jgi:putative tryptophan/tyrosine transport system permease protein
MLGNILLDTLVTALPLVPVFLGVYIVLRIREDFDMTVEGSFVLGGAVTAVAITGGTNPALAMLLGTVAGAVAGLGTALLNLFLRIPILMTGLVMNMALFTITLRILGTPSVSLIGKETIFSSVAPRPGPDADVAVSIMVGVIVAVILAAFALFLRTELGLALRASGGNSRMVRSQGVNDNGLLILSLMLSNGLSALGGGLMVQMQGFADINMGTGMFIAGVGAVLLGVLLFNPGGSQVVRIVLAVLVGGLVYRLILVAALRFGLPAGDLKGITALTLVAAVAAQAYLAPALAKYRRGLAERRQQAPRRRPPAPTQSSPVTTSKERDLEATNV